MTYLLRCLLLLAIILTLPVYGRSATYQWRDDEGISHFTDNRDGIPLRFLSRVKELPSIHPETPKVEIPATTVSTPPDPTAAGPDQRTSPVDPRGIRQELDTLKGGLPGKKDDLAKLHHQWTVRKGRNPTKDELKEFDKKRAKGEVEVKDNPYINKNALSAPGRSREAYYKKLEEVRQDEERILQLEAQLGAAGAPSESRR